MTAKDQLAEALRRYVCASYTAPKSLLDRCDCNDTEIIELLVVALKEATRGPNAAHDGGACNRLLTQAITGLSPEQITLP